MDMKNRVTVPSEWLSEKEGGETFWIVPNLSGDYLRVMPPEEFVRQEETLDAKLPPGKQRENAKRIFYSLARQVETDKQGRILLAADLCTRAGIATNITFVGLKTKFEIWDATKWSNVANLETALDHETRAALEATGL